MLKTKGLLWRRVLFGLCEIQYMLSTFCLGLYALCISSFVISIKNKLCITRTELTRVSIHTRLVWGKKKQKIHYKLST